MAHPISLQNSTPVSLEGFPWPFPITSEPWHPLTNATDTSCESENHVKKLLEYTLLGTAGAIFLALNLLSLLKERQLAIPVNFLDSTPYRLTYCFILTLLSADVFRDLSDGASYIRARRNGILDALSIFSATPSLIFLRETLIYFPILACVNFTLPCLGHVIGCLYTILMGGYNIYVEVILLQGCTKGQLTWKQIMFYLLEEVPVFLGYVGVALWFFFQTATEAALLFFCARKKLKNQHLQKSQEHFSTEVKTLLKCPERYGGNMGPSPGKRGNIFNFISWGLRYVLPFKKSFQYPLSFLASISMSCMAIYILFMRTIHLESELTEDLWNFVNSFNVIVAELAKLAPFSPLFANLTVRAEGLLYDAQSFAEAYRVILPFSCCIAFGLYVFFIMYFIQTFHKRLKRAAQGDIRFLIASEPLPSKAYILASGMKYCAFQMIYMVTSWIIYNIMLAALLTFGLIFYYLFKNFNHFAIFVWCFFMIPMAWSTVLHHVQLFLSKYLFLKREDGDLIHIRFRSLYLLLTYILFFFNAIFGFVLSYLRVFASFMFTVVMYFRIDWDVYMRGLEGWDFGHRTYVGYMYLEYTRNNAVLRAFLQVLAEEVRRSRERPRPPLTSSAATENHTVQKGDSSSSDSCSSPSISSDTSLLVSSTSLKRCTSIRHKSNSAVVRSRRARNLWLVAYTLIHNPQLSMLTASSLNSAHPDEIL